MARCVYSRAELVPGSTDPASIASVEHIIPFALGGSNAFVIHDASRKANNDLGSSVDAPFANLLPIAIKRHQLSLASQNGNIPPIIWNGRGPEGQPVLITVEAGGPIRCEAKREVGKDAAGEITTVSGSRDQVEAMLQGMLRGWRKRGREIRSIDGSILTSADELISTARVTLIDKVGIDIEEFDFPTWAQGILKIALSFGHWALGPSWSFGEQAEHIRAIVNHGEPAFRGTSLRGTLAGEWDRTIRAAVGKKIQSFNAFEHTLCLLPFGDNQRISCLISLFGGNGVPEAIIDFGPVAPNVSAMWSDDRVLSVCGCRIDPKSRTARNITTGEIFRNAARSEPSNKRTRRAHLDMMVEAERSRRPTIMIPGKR